MDAPAAGESTAVSDDTEPVCSDTASLNASQLSASPAATASKPSSTVGKKRPSESRTRHNGGHSKQRKTSRTAGVAGRDRDADSDEASSEGEGEDLEAGDIRDAERLRRENEADLRAYSGDMDDWIAPDEQDEEEDNPVDGDELAAFHAREMEALPLDDMSRNSHIRGFSDVRMYGKNADETDDAEVVTGTKPLKSVAPVSSIGVTRTDRATLPSVALAAAVVADPGSTDFPEPDDDENRIAFAEENDKLENDGSLHDPSGMKLIELVREYYATSMGDTRPRKLFRLLRHLERKWTMPGGMTAIDFAHQRFGFNVNELKDPSTDIGAILNEQFQFFHCEAIAIYRLFGHQEWGVGHKNYKTAEQVFNKVMKQIYDCSMMLYFENSYFATTSPRAMALPPFNPWQFRMEKAKEYTGIHKLMHFLLRRLEQLNLRKRGGTIQQEVLIDGKRSGHWETSGTIQEWVLKEANSDGNSAIWKEAVMHYRKAADYLEACFDRHFQYICCSRRVWSFNNGRYFGDADDKFDQFIPYEECHGLDNIVSANLFRVQFNSFTEVGYDYKRDPETGDYRMEYGGTIKQSDIDAGLCEKPLPSWFDALLTPAMDKIMIAQKWDRDVQKQFWAQFGRLFYPVGEVCNLWTKTIQHGCNCVCFPADLVCLLVVCLHGASLTSGRNSCSSSDCRELV